MRIKYFLITIIALMMASLGLTAQTKTTMPTRYHEFRPSVITLSDGRVLRENLTNIFLKNSTLLYVSGEVVKEANMDNILKVDFEDRSYVNLNGQLAWLVDSVGHNMLYEIDLFDQVAYEANLKNNVNITNIDFSQDVMSTANVDLNNEGDYMMPVIPHFYYLYEGKLIKAKDRVVQLALPKDRNRQFKTVVGQPNFSWIDPDCLMLLLRFISTPNNN